MSEQVIHGIGVSPGVAYGPALVVEWRFPEVPDRAIGPGGVDDEIAKLRAAVETVAQSLDRLRQRVAERAGIEESKIFDAQVLMVRDPDFLAACEHLIRHNQLAAETAYEFKALEVRVAWGNAANVRLRERLADLTAVQIRMLRALIGHPDEDLEITQPDGPVVIVAHELSPGLTVQLDRDRLAGLVSEEGTRTSHAAILAHSLGIPAVMGVPDALARIKTGTVLLIDGASGAVLLDPSPADLREASTQVSRRRKFDLELEGLTSEPCVTPDGLGIQLLANVDLPEEIEQAVRHGGVALGEASGDRRVARQLRHHQIGGEVDPPALAGALDERQVHRHEARLDPPEERRVALELRRVALPAAQVLEIRPDTSVERRHLLGQGDEAAAQLPHGRVAGTDRVQQESQVLVRQATHHRTAELGADPFVGALVDAGVQPVQHRRDQGLHRLLRPLLEAVSARRSAVVHYEPRTGP